jgi:hypothetical protein
MTKTYSLPKPYVVPIDSNQDDSHQISPHWLVTFTRFNTRDTYNDNTFGPISPVEVRLPLIVENDCISVAVSTSKTNYTPSATLTLALGDINYLTAVAPGDFVIINMVNSSTKARELRTRAGLLQPINRSGDGFKGIFKINSVGKILNVDPNSGQKTFRCQVTAYGFTEWNNIIYYNPTLGDSIDKDIITYNVNEGLLEVLNSKLRIQDVLKLLPGIIMGNGKVNATNPERLLSTKKVPYEIPRQVFQLLGIEGNSADDLYRTMLGTWGESSGKSLRRLGLNPNYSTKGNIQTINPPIKGRIPIQTSPLTNVRLIDLMLRYSNPLINETYCCFRTEKDSNLILPKLIIRQKPFNTEHGQKNTPLNGTRFLTLPRWKISPDLIYSLNISRNESLRFNFVHIIGTTGNNAIDQTIIADQNSKGGNVVYDDVDIGRHGLRSYTKVSNFDWPQKEEEGYATSLAPEWAKLTWDWIYGGHLRTNGTIVSVGIEEDICIGDNLELQNTVYHIESINHTGAISPDGRKVFRTTMTLTHGIDKRSSRVGPVYPEMDFTDTYLERLNDDFYKNRIDTENIGLPGFSDTQDIVGRTNGEEVKETKNQSFTPLKNKIKK